MFDYLIEKKYFHILKGPSKICNSDRTDFMVCLKMKNVITTRGCRHVYEIDKRNARLNLTVLRLNLYSTI